MTDMPEIMNMNTNKARFNPASVFDRPLDIIDAVGLTRGQKIASLERWQEDLLEELAATNEGMPSNGYATQNATLLEEIKLAIARLRPAAQSSEGINKLEPGK